MSSWSFSIPTVNRSAAVGIRKTSRRASNTWPRLSSRQNFAQAGIRVKEEASFQGGDGYLYFITPDVALASVTRIIEYMLPIPTDDVEIRSRLSAG